MFWTNISLEEIIYIVSFVLVNSRMQLDYLSSVFKRKSMFDRHNRIGVGSLRRADLNPGDRRSDADDGGEREELPRWQKAAARGGGNSDGLSCKSGVVELYDKTSCLTSLTE